MAGSQEKDYLFDIRVMDRNLRKNLIAADDVKSYVGGLADMSENAELVTKESIFGDEMIHGHKKKYVPAYKGRPQVVYTRIGESDMEGEEDESDFDSEDAAEPDSEAEEAPAGDSTEE